MSSINCPNHLVVMFSFSKEDLSYAYHALLLPSSQKVLSASNVIV